MFGSFGWMELMLILIIVLIIFGAGKIPQLGEGLGKAIKGFKKSVNEADAIDVTPPPSDTPPPRRRRWRKGRRLVSRPTRRLHKSITQNKDEKVGLKLEG